MSVERAWPDGVYVRGDRQPGRRLYAQVTRTTAAAGVHVAGSLPFDEHNRFVGEGDMAAQTRQVLEVIRRSLAVFGATPAGVVRTKTYVTDIEEYGRAGHAEWLAFFGENLPASTTVEVTRLTDPRAMIEIEAYAEVT